MSDRCQTLAGIVGYGGFGTVRRATLKNAPTVVRAIKTAPWLLRSQAGFPVSLGACCVLSGTQAEFEGTELRAK